MEEMTSTYTNATLNLNPGLFLFSIITNNLDGRVQSVLLWGKHSRILAKNGTGDGSKLSVRPE